MLKRFAILAFCAIAGAAAARTGWQFIDLGTLGGNNALATSINNRGDIAGASGVQPGTRTDTDAGGPRAFLWINGLMQNLGSAGEMSEAKSVNHHGVVVGTRGDLTGGDMTTWKDGVAHSLGLRGVPFDVNKHGAVVGFERHPDFSATPILWRDGVVFELPALVPGRHALPVAINDHGVIAGFADSGDNMHAAIWEKGVIRDLGTLGGAFSSATDINDRGVVVGSSGIATFGQQAFIYDGVMRPLFPVSTGEFAHAVAINNRDEVVGQFFAGGVIHGFHFADGKLAFLKDLLPPEERSRYTVVVPMDINDRGWIVGGARRTDSALRAFVLIPPQGR